MSAFIKKYPRALVSRHATLDGWVIDIIQRANAKPKRVAATYASITWAHKAARAKLGVPGAPTPVGAAPAAPKGFEPFKKPASGAGTCIPCGRPMRKAGTKAADHPGTTLRQREGLCQSCCQRQAVGLGPLTPVHTRETA